MIIKHNHRLHVSALTSKIGQNSEKCKIMYSFSVIQVTLLKKISKVVKIKLWWFSVCAHLHLDRFTTIQNQLVGWKRRTSLWDLRIYPWVENMTIDHLSLPSLVQVVRLANCTFYNFRYFDYFYMSRHCTGNLVQYAKHALLVCIFLIPEIITKTFASFVDRLV